ncbi:hypothetical protein [Micromonospora tulbaghiae]|uniref:hypothetical protein n=1 Tax=Micromonospora tulbaghiae TaxID=479978 RepID=UPI000B85C660|nr:hypothetical protein [Micromonospora tulbaghiae]MDX5460150.1 hypothetical protein [Micromonospora tulbaghiae]
MTNPQSAIDIHLLELHNQVEKNIRQATGGHGSSLGQLLQLDLDVMAWEQELLGRPEVGQLTAARRELGFAIYAASAGLYLHAYAGLRLFLELSFASVYFSANELHRRRWVADRADFSWAKALDENDGVMAPSFVREFSETAAKDAAQFAKDAASAYRHCSQFIHGKVAVTSLLPDAMQFSPLVLQDWLATAVKSARTVLFLLYARYGDELLGGGDQSGRLAFTVESSFGHLKEVRRRFGLPIEGE